MGGRGHGLVGAGGTQPKRRAGSHLLSQTSVEVALGCIPQKAIMDRGVTLGVDGLARARRTSRTPAAARALERSREILYKVEPHTREANEGRA